MEAIRGDHRGEDEEEEVRDVERGSDGNEDSSRGGDDEDSDNDSIDSDEDDTDSTKDEDDEDSTEDEDDDDHNAIVPAAPSVPAAVPVFRDFKKPILQICLRELRLPHSGPITNLIRTLENHATRFNCRKTLIDRLIVITTPYEARMLSQRNAREAASTAAI